MVTGTGVAGVGIVNPGVWMGGPQKLGEGVTSTNTVATMVRATTGGGDGHGGPFSVAHQPSLGKRFAGNVMASWQVIGLVPQLVGSGVMRLGVEIIRGSEQVMDGYQAPEVRSPDDLKSPLKLTAHMPLFFIGTVVTIAGCAVFYLTAFVSLYPAGAVGAILTPLDLASDCVQEAAGRSKNTFFRRLGGWFSGISHTLQRFQSTLGRIIAAIDPEKISDRIP